MRQSSEIFVLETASAPDLAFQAETEGQAVAITRARWFRDAVAEVIAGPDGANAALNAERVRAATAAEAGIYRQLADEFDGPARQFLIADLSKFPERYAGKAPANSF